MSKIEGKSTNQQHNQIEELRPKTEPKIKYEHISKEYKSNSNLQALIHELSVHQEELEMQNEQLRQTRLALEESQQKFIDLFDFAPVGYLIFDTKAIILQANLSIATLLDTPRKELINKQFSQYVCKEDSDKWYLHFHQVITTGQCQTSELRLAKKDQTKLQTFLRSEPIIDKGGKVRSFRTSITNISQMKETQDKLRHTQENPNRQFNELQAIYNFAPIGLCIFDREMRYVRVNKFLADIHGISEQEHIGRTIYHVIPEFAQKAGEISKKIFRTGKPVLNIELKGTTPAEPERQRVWQENWAPIKDEQGDIIGINVSALEITNQKKAEQELREAQLQLKNLLKYREAELSDEIRKRSYTEDELWESEQKYKLLVENLPAVTFLASADPPPILYYISPQVEQVLGYKPEEYKKDPEIWVGEIHPDDRPRVVSELKAAQDKYESFLSEYRTYDKKGDLKWLRTEIRVVHDENNEPLFVQGVMYDITEKKIYENRLLEQAELLDLAHDAVIVHNLNGKITFWNKGAENTYGWKKDEVNGKITHEVLKTRFSEPLLKITAAISSIGKWEGELVNTTKDGEKITVESRWALRRNENGEPSAILEIDRDITERKAAQMQIAEAHKYTESIIETIQEALVVLDPELKIISANKSFYHMFSLNPDETEGNYIYRLDQNQWNIPELKKLLEEILPQNTSFEDFEMDYVPSKGTGRVLLLNARRIFRRKKRTEMILLAIGDITERKRQEREIRELTEQLLLAEEEQRQQIATDLHDTIGQMLSFSKRELAALLKNPDLRTEDNLSKVFDFIDKSIAQSRSLITTLSSPTLNTFGLEAGIEELTEQFTKDNDIACEVRCDEEPRRLEKKLELILYRSVKELLCNIAKYAGAKKVDIELTPEDNFLLLRVADDGKGFDTSILQNIHNERQSFGLYSIRQRLTNIGGFFDIRSKRKKGTMVTLKAPLILKSNSKKI